MNTESGADTTDQDTMAESSSGNQSSSQLAQPSTEHAPPSRTRVASVAAARGLGIRIASSDGPRLNAGLPASPRPPARSPKTAVHPQDVATSSSLAPTQQQR